MPTEADTASPPPPPGPDCGPAIRRLLLEAELVPPPDVLLVRDSLLLVC